jgi:hypothetical protein
MLHYKTIPVTPFAQNCPIVWCDDAKLAARLNLPIIGPHLGDQYWIDLLPEQGAMFCLQAAWAAPTFPAEIINSSLTASRSAYGLTATTRFLSPVMAPRAALAESERVTPMWAERETAHPALAAQETNMPGDLQP